MAKPFFLNEKPPSKWNQGGGSLGGPLMRDRAFFFTAFESYRLKRALEINVNVPTQRFRDLLLTAMPYPETRLMLDQYPLPTEPVSATALTGVFIGAGNKENNDDHLDTRVDFRVMGGNLSGTFTYGHPFLSQESQLPGQPRSLGDHRPGARPRATPSLEGGGARRRASATTTTSCREPIRSTLLDPVNPGPIGHRCQESPADSDDQLSRSPATWKRAAYPGSAAELLLRATADPGDRQARLQVRRPLCHASRWAVQRDRPDLRVSDRSRHAGQPSQLPLPSGAAGRWRLWTTTNWGLFVQDDWRINSKLVLNLGVRYD